MANPNLFDTVTRASGGTSIHWPSSRTRYFPSFVSQSTSSMLWPSAAEQQGPLRLARLSNHCLSGEFKYFPSRSRVRANPGRNSTDHAAQKIMPRLTKEPDAFVIRIVRFFRCMSPQAKLFVPEHTIELDCSPTGSVNAHLCSLAFVCAMSSGAPG